ncbi:hypothetical protein [Nocardia sp. NPDC004722]
MTRLIARLVAIVQLDGPIWFDRRLITQLDVLGRTSVAAIGQEL